MNLKLATGPMVQALGELLLYQDQHDPTHHPTTKLHLAWIHKEPIPFHLGLSTTVLKANENAALPEEVLPSTGIDKYWNGRDRAVETPNSYSTNPREN